MDEEIKKKVAELEAKVAQLESTIAARLDRVTNYTIQSAADIIKYGNENSFTSTLRCLLSSTNVRRAIRICQARKCWLGAALGERQSTLRDTPKSWPRNSASRRKNKAALFCVSFLAGQKP